MKTALIVLITPLIVWSLMRALVVPLLSARSAAGGMLDGDLTACASADNCRTSAATDANAIAPLAFDGASEAQWQLFVDTVASLPGYKLLKRDGDLVHFEARTPLMNYRDDLELLWQRDAGRIAVRSASRVGIKDLGANADRIAMIAKLLELQTRESR